MNHRVNGSSPQRRPIGCLVHSTGQYAARSSSYVRSSETVACPWISTVGGFDRPLAVGSENNRRNMRISTSVIRFARQSDARGDEESARIWLPYGSDFHGHRRG